MARSLKSRRVFPTFDLVSSLVSYPSTIQDDDGEKDSLPTGLLESLIVSAIPAPRRICPCDKRRSQSSRRTLPGSGYQGRKCDRSSKERFCTLRVGTRLTRQASLDAGPRIRVSVEARTVDDDSDDENAKAKDTAQQIDSNNRDSTVKPKLKEYQDLDPGLESSLAGWTPNDPLLEMRSKIYPARTLHVSDNSTLSSVTAYGV